MVILSRIYTRTGDDGSTSLGDFSRTSKNDPRLIAFANVDEANSSIGVAVAAGELRNDLTAMLRRIQNDLFDVGADLCTPLVADPEHPPLRVQAAWVDELEADCNRLNDELETLRSFILPGGSVGSAHLHLARTITRRAERATWAAIAQVRRRRGSRGHRRTRRGQPPDSAVPQPALGPALPGRPQRQPQPRWRRAVDTGRRSLKSPSGICMPLGGESTAVQGRGATFPAPPPY